MSSELPIVKTYTSKDNKFKMQAIARYNKRSVSKELEYVIETYIAEFERKHGKL